MVDLSDDTEIARRRAQVTRVVRRRRWSDEEKGRIVAEAIAPDAVIADVARRHDLAPQHLSNWIRAAKDGRFALAADGMSGMADGQRTAEADQLRRNLLLWTQELDDAESCNDVAWELAKQRDLVDALNLSSCALRLAPNDPNYHDTRGLALALSGRRDVAIAEFEFFIENAQGIERFARNINIRREWIETLRTGGAPFAGDIQ